MAKPRYTMLRTRAAYHIIAKLVRGNELMKEDRIKSLYLKTIERANDKYDFELISFCIMSNHIHLIIRPKKKEVLSKIMQFIQGTFAINYNKITESAGKVWNYRFYSKIIETIKYLLTVIDYIHNNPLKAGICIDNKEYKFSSAYHIKPKILSSVYLYLL